MELLTLIITEATRGYLICGPVVLWCRVLVLRTIPPIISTARFVFDLQVLVEKAVFDHGTEVQETSIYLCATKDGHGKWLLRFSSDFEEIQNSTQENTSQQTLFPTPTLYDIFHSLSQEYCL